MSTIALLAAMLLSLTACITQPPAPPSPPAPATPGLGSCDASKAQFLVGYESGLAIQDQARTRSGAATIRTLKPGQAVTLEYNADRLNLSLDAGGRIVRVTCG